MEKGREGKGREGKGSEGKGREIAYFVQYWESTCKIWMPCVKYIPRYRPAYLKMVLRWRTE